MSKEQDPLQPEAIGAKEPSLFTPEPYVERQEERLITEKVDASQKGGMTKPVVEFYSGVPGIGKTWFLEEIKTQYALREDSNLPKPPITAFVDLETVNQGPLVLQKLVRQMNSQLPESEEIPDLSGLDKDKAAQLVVDRLSALSEKHLPILLFDNLTSISKEFGYWFEEKIVCPLAITDRVLFVFSGDSWREWGKFGVRQRLEPVELSVFDREQTYRQLERLYGKVSDQERKAVFRFTEGLPFANREVMELLRENAGQVDKRFGESVYEDIIKRKLLAEIPEDLKPILMVAATLRKFNPTSLRRFSVAFLESEYKEKPEGFYPDAIRDMQETKLVWWSSADGGYILHPVVRKILDRNLQVREPDEFGRRHSEAARLYQEWLGKYPRNGIGFLFELMFHQAQALNVQGRPQDELVGVFANNLKVLKEHPETRWNLPEMAEELTKGLDRDRELLIETFDPVVAKDFRKIAAQFVKEIKQFFYTRFLDE